MQRDIRGSSMLKRTSRFVLEVLPYLLSALIAAVIVPGFLYSQARETKAGVAPNGPGLEMIHWDHAVLSPGSDKTAGDKVAYR
jgi:hypothetical protein